MDLPAPAVLMMGIRTHSFLIYSIYSQPIERNINASDSSEISVTSVNSLFPAALFRKRNLPHGVPHQIRSFIALNCDFRDLSENLKRMNLLKNCIRII